MRISYALSNSESASSHRKVDYFPDANVELPDNTHMVKNDWLIPSLLTDDFFTGNGYTGVQLNDLASLCGVPHAKIQYLLKSVSEEKPSVKFASLEHLKGEDLYIPFDRHRVIKDCFAASIIRFYAEVEENFTAIETLRKARSVAASSLKYKFSAEEKTSINKSIIFKEPVPTEKLVIETTADPTPIKTRKRRSSAPPPLALAPSISTPSAQHTIHRDTPTYSTVKKFNDYRPTQVDGVTWYKIEEECFRFNGITRRDLEFLTGMHESTIRTIMTKLLSCKDPKELDKTVHRSLKHLVGVDPIQKVKSPHSIQLIEESYAAELIKFAAWKGKPKARRTIEKLEALRREQSNQNVDKIA